MENDILFKLHQKDLKEILIMFINSESYLLIQNMINTWPGQTGMNEATWEN